MVGTADIGQSKGLAHAIAQVLGDLRASESREKVKAAHEAAREQKVREDAQLEIEWAEKEQAFLRKYPNPETQESDLGKYVDQTETLAVLGGPILRRRIAIGRWWKDLDPSGQLPSHI